MFSEQRENHQSQYFSIAITCAENDMVLLIGLRHGTAAVSLGVDDDLRYLTQRLREAWLDVDIIVRADADFGVPLMYEVCEELSRSTANGLTPKQTYTFGIGMNSARKHHARNGVMIYWAKQPLSTMRQKRNNVDRARE